MRLVLTTATRKNQRVVVRTDHKTLSRVIAHVAASYARRELDRKFYDKVMNSSVGRQLGDLPPTSKYAFEFLLYSIVAVVSENMRADGSAVRSFLRDVLTDAPSEIAKRMIHQGNQVTTASRDALRVLDELSDAQFGGLIADAKDVVVLEDDPRSVADRGQRGRGKPRSTGTKPPHVESHRLFLRAANRLERIRRRVRGKPPSEF